MDYRLAEGTLTWPSAWRDVQDQTINVFQLSALPPLNLVINRDPVPDGESPSAYLRAQRDSLARELHGFQTLAEHALANPVFELPALEYAWDSPEGRVHQLNALCVSGRRMLSFTFTSPVALAAALRQRCLALLESYAPYRAA
jgi:Uncharacterized conserved protein